MRTVHVNLERLGYPGVTYDGVVRLECADPLDVEPPGWYTDGSPDGTRGYAVLEANVLRDVTRVMQPGTSWSDIGRVLLPYAFRLLCMAAFRR